MHPCPLSLAKDIYRETKALIIRFGRELLEAPKVSDETFDVVRARYGENGVLELTAIMSIYMMNASSCA